MSIVDRPEFAGFRPDFLKIIGGWEVIFQKARENALARLPAEHAELLAPIMAPTAEAYLMDLLPFFKDLSAMLDETEILRQRLKGRFN